MSQVIHRAFKKLKDLPAWNVKPSVGTFLTMEFGQPSLGEMKGPEGRIVYVRGEWHLWIYCCSWRAFEGKVELGDDSMPKCYKEVTRRLDGQKLERVRVYKNGRTDFRFEYGTVLQTRPYDRDSEQWMLYEPGGNVLSFRADGQWRYGEGKLKPEERRWKPL